MLTELQKVRCGISNCQQRLNEPRDKRVICDVRRRLDTREVDCQFRQTSIICPNPAMRLGAGNRTAHCAQISVPKKADIVTAGALDTLVDSVRAMTNSNVLA